MCGVYSASAANYFFRSYMFEQDHTLAVLHNLCLPRLNSVAFLDTKQVASPTVASRPTSFAMGESSTPGHAGMNASKVAALGNTPLTASPA